MSETKRDGMQGEGNKAADRRYRREARRFEEAGRVEPAAEEARREVEEQDEEQTPDS